MAQFLANAAVSALFPPGGVQPDVVTANPKMKFLSNSNANASMVNFLANNSNHTVQSLDLQPSPGIDKVIIIYQLQC